jgi:hypothetical protein
VSLYAYVLISTGVGGGGGRHRRKAGRILDDHPSFRLAGVLGGPDFGDRVADTFVEDNVERVAAAVETLEAYRNAGALSADRLRSLVRAQMLRQLQGHAVETPRP